MGSERSWKGSLVTDTTLQVRHLTLLSSVPSNTWLTMLVLLGTAAAKHTPYIHINIGWAEEENSMNELNAKLTEQVRLYKLESLFLDSE